MTHNDIEQILIIIKDLSLKDALIYLVSLGIVDFSKVGYQKIKILIQNKQNEGRYAFVPNSDEAIYLQKSFNNPCYKEISLLVPSYKYLGLIRTGFLLKDYNNKIESNIDKDKNKIRVLEIKRQILCRPGGFTLLKIAKFPSTEFFSLVLSYLHKLKINNYPEEHLEAEFNDLINSWQNSSKFVRSEDSLDNIIEFCRDKIEKGFNRFFLLGLYDKSIELIENGLKSLKEQIDKGEYETVIIKRESKDLPMIEVLIFKNLLKI